MDKDQEIQSLRAENEELRNKLRRLAIDSLALCVGLDLTSSSQTTEKEVIKLTDDDDGSSLPDPFPHRFPSGD